MRPETTNKGLQERQNTPQVLNNSGESFNPKSVNNNSKPFIHSGCGYNSQKGDRISKHTVFVIGIDGMPLTPTTPLKARKLMKGNQAKPIWSKFGTFGLQMLVPTGKVIPKTVLGIDMGTKFEGYAVTVGKENNLAVMWKLPDKNNIIKKLVERKIQRRSRRFRNCRRRKCRSDNRGKEGFIAPSQVVVVNSRMKVISEFFRCYPISDVAIEDVKFNHSKHRWGKNFSTMEIGKNKIYNWIQERANLVKYEGFETEALRNIYDYHKSSNKSAEIFNAHCSDALAIATDVNYKQHIPQGTFIVVDDTYRPVRRKLHDAQFSKGGIRYPYSTGNFKGIRKGTICEFGKIVGGSKNRVYVRNKNNKRMNKSIENISHQFKNI
jgi:hypothetical protein